MTLRLGSCLSVFFALLGCGGESERTHSNAGGSGGTGGAGDSAGEGGAAPAAFGECFVPEGLGLGSNDLTCDDVCSRAGATCSLTGCVNGATVVVYNSTEAPCPGAPVGPSTCTNADYQTDPSCSARAVTGSGLPMEWTCTTPVPIGSLAHPSVAWDLARCCCEN